MGDQLWMSQYILHHVCEDLGVLCSFDPKPMSDWNSLSAYCSFSTDWQCEKMVGLLPLMQQLKSLHQNMHSMFHGTSLEEERMTNVT